MILFFVSVCFFVHLVHILPFQVKEQAQKDNTLVPIILCAFATIVLLIAVLILAGFTLRRKALEMKPPGIDTRRINFTFLFPNSITNVGHTLINFVLLILSYLCFSCSHFTVPSMTGTMYQSLFIVVH